MPNIAIRVKNPTTKLSWFDRIMLSWLLLTLVAMFVSAGFIWGAGWMSDLDVYSQTITAQ